MAGSREQSRKQSVKIAYCGMMVALSLVLMLTGGIIPIATYCVPMMSSILLLPVLLEFGRKPAWTAYAAVSLIALLVGIDKEAAFFYLFLGYYPIIKWEIEKIRHKRLKVLAKLLVFNASILLMYVLLGAVMNMDAVVEEFLTMGPVLLIVFVILLNVCLFLYDRLLLPLLYLYANRIRPKFRFLIR